MSLWDVFKGMTQGKAGDVLHLTGSLILVLAIQRAFGMNWEIAALITFNLGVAWELGDEYIGKGTFDPEGWSWKDIFLDSLGCLLSFPLGFYFTRL